MCRGVQSYFSTVGGGSCWTCPSGYRRYSPTRPMDHPQACRTRWVPWWERAPTKPATFQRYSTGCEPGQFHVAMDGRAGSSCYACPPGFDRTHAFGLDTRKCWPKERCFNGSPAKQPPLKFSAGLPDPNWKDILGNLLGKEVSDWLELRPGVCAPEFDIGEAAKLDIKQFNVIILAMNNLGEELLEDIREGKRGNLKQLLETKRWSEAWAILEDTPAFRAFAETAREAGNRSVSVGVAGDFQVGVGLNSEFGLAIDLVDERVKPYESVGLSKGVSLGVDIVINVGVWQGAFESSCAQGFTASAGAVVSLGGGVWYSYYDLEKQKQPQLLGVTRAAGLGLGWEGGEYNEVCTWRLDEAFDALGPGRA